MAILEIVIDTQSLDTLKRELDADARQMRVATSRAINDTIRRTASRLSRETREIVALKKKIVDKSIGREFSKPDDLEGDVVIRDLGPLSLRAFAPRQGKRTPATVVVEKAVGRVPAEQVGRTRTGAPASGERAFGPRIERLGKGVFQRVGKERLPIQKLFGPGVFEVIEEHRIPERVIPDSERYLHERLNERLKLVF